MDFLITIRIRDAILEAGGPVSEANEEAAREGVDMIFTFVYGGEVDDKFVDGVTKTVESYSDSV